MTRINREMVPKFFGDVAHLVFTVTIPAYLKQCLPCASSAVIMCSHYEQDCTDSLLQNLCAAIARIFAGRLLQAHARSSIFRGVQLPHNTSMQTADFSALSRA